MNFVCFKLKLRYLGVLYHLHFKFSQLKCAFFALASIEKTTVGYACVLNFTRTQNPSFFFCANSKCKWY